MPKGLPRLAHDVKKFRPSAAGNPRALVDLARLHTSNAIRIIAELMEGKGGVTKVLGEDGKLVEIPVEVPAAVRLKAAELLIERGYGKAPQSITIDQTTHLSVGERHLSIAEKIIAIKAAALTAGNTTDLEAGAVTELPAPEGREILPIAAQRAEEFLRRREAGKTPQDARDDV